ncbi:putative F-box protein At3g29830 [Hevea brasiliensis]|uniref:putative F-box protein At3g29830 n=1 Tax=Hevea brasiliensis TaxID=3981 RepID=UPI0025CBE318|nr:putative F-box protein At3g29830 [Hevea brasiliensis]
MDNNNRDMFLTLETSLLVLIVSYLPFKEAVRTSILSKQWRNVWCETTNLEFHEKFFVNLEKTDKNQRIQRSSFFDFVRKFLACYPGYSKFCNVLLKTKWFPYRCAKLCHFCHLKKCEGVGTSLILHGEKKMILRNIQQLLNCLSRFKNFTVLKGVSLGWIEINLASIKTLLLSCPLLKSLGLKKCWNIDHLEICLPNWRLKNLYIDKCNFIQDFFWIEGPNLQFLKYSGKVGRFHMYNQREIVEANLNFGMEPEFGEIGLLLYDFLQEFLAVKVLTVCSVLLQDYEPPFELNPHEFWSRNAKIDHCIHRSLKVVNVKGFKGTMNELYVLRYIINCGRKLRKLNLFIANKEDDNGQNRKSYMAKARLVKKFQSSSRKLQLLVF